MTMGGSAWSIGEEGGVAPASRPPVGAVAGDLGDLGDEGLCFGDLGDIPACALSFGERGGDDGPRLGDLGSLTKRAWLTWTSCMSKMSALRAGTPHCQTPRFLPSTPRRGGAAGVLALEAAHAFGGTM
jgi:hypothetical protein